MFGKNLTSKRSKNKIFPWIPRFLICSMAKSENPEMGNQQKAF